MIRVLSCALAVFLYSASTAWSAGLLYRATGTAVEIDGVSGLSEGDTITLTFNYDPSTALKNASGPFTQQWLAAISDFSVESDVLFVTESSPSIFASNDTSTGFEGYSIIASGNDGNDPALNRPGLIYLILPSEASLQELPAALPLFSELDASKSGSTFFSSGPAISYFAGTLAGAAKTARFELTGLQVVPLPATAWLFASALGLLVYIRDG